MESDETKINFQKFITQKLSKKHLFRYAAYFILLLMIIGFLYTAYQSKESNTHTLEKDTFELKSTDIDTSNFH